MPKGGLAEFFETLLPVLGERDRRVAVGLLTRRGVSAGHRQMAGQDPAIIRTG